MNKRKWGIRFDSTGEQLEEIIKNHSNLKTSEVYVVGEIGCAGCDTLKSIYDIVRENRPDKYLVCGFDIPQCAQDYINDLIVNFNGKPNILRKEDLMQGRGVKINEMYLFLMESPQEFVKDFVPFEFDLVNVDGIHSKNWVQKDFLSIEGKVKKGGFVAFHDYCLDSQGTDPQIGGGFIEVREAVKELGLADNSRPGWEFVTEILGSRTTGTGTKDGNGMAVIRKL